MYKNWNEHYKYVWKKSVRNVPTEQYENENEQWERKKNWYECNAETQRVQVCEM